MYEWSETDLMARDAVRAFIDKEIRPNLDALESGEIPPYPIIRKLFAEFGIDAMARELTVSSASTGVRLEPELFLPPAPAIRRGNLFFLN